MKERKKKEVSFVQCFVGVNGGKDNSIQRKLRNKFNNNVFLYTCNKMRNSFVN